TKSYSDLSSYVCSSDLYSSRSLPLSSAFQQSCPNRLLFQLVRLHERRGNNQNLRRIPDRGQFVLFPEIRCGGDYHSPSRGSQLRAQTPNLRQCNQGHHCWWKYNNRRHKKILRAQSRHNPASLLRESCPMTTPPVLFS